MGRAMEVVTGFATAPGAVFTPVTMAAGNSATIRNGAPGTMIALLSAWSDHQVAGNVRVFSPAMHDAVNALRMFSVASEVDPLLPMRPNQRFQPNDVLTFQITGSAVAGQIETACMLIFYQNLPGVDAHLIYAAECNQRARNLMLVENTLALGVAGGYSGAEAINAENDQGKAETEYALVGYTCSVECACVRWTGADSGNLGVGGPGNELDAQLTRGWFYDLSVATGLPTIPVFNFSQKGGILIDGAQDQLGADPLVISIFVELGPPPPASPPKPA